MKSILAGIDYLDLHKFKQKDIPAYLEECMIIKSNYCFIKVLDEADRLIEDDFGEQLEVIFEVLPKRRQTLLFSATMTKNLEDMQDLAMTKPFFWQQISQ